MIRTTALVLLLLFFVESKAQKVEKDSLFLSGGYRVDLNKGKASKDILNKNIKLLLFGGLRPKHFTGQEDFEQKYHVTYWSFGCVLPNRINVLAYNTEIFKYLDKKYGNAWRKEVRPDVVGL